MKTGVMKDSEKMIRSMMLSPGRATAWLGRGKLKARSWGKKLVFQLTLITRLLQ